ncbi:hypothetical protein BOTBODRAFT_164122 [Botryobasidium botryosum FD-172 SS1]|uniref:Uncharacterized protein n=1 Tax=Botryobasidium botryosum (strain FD-172 SS1) TaxID=930990 RepID=A0A067ME63_BOTB1|nr:hypothetical protein BOTBODRAFT_164122 [Botryobasidium botryosum FD-172 SS1]
MNTPAFKHDDLSDLKAMLAAGGDVEDVDSAGKTRLHYAAGWASLPMVRLLIELKANVHARDNDGRQPLHLAALRQTFSSGRSEVMRLLLDAGAELDATDSRGDTPLSLAKAVHALCDAGADVDAADAHGDAPLHYATEGGSASAVQLLLGKGASPLERARDGTSPLHNALVLMRHPDGSRAVASLLGASVDVNTANNNGSTPLHCAASLGASSAVLLLLKVGANPRALDAQGAQPLHHVAGCGLYGSGNEIQPIITALLVAGRGLDNPKPLKYALSCGNITAVKLLMNAGATVCHQT